MRSIANGNRCYISETAGCGTSGPQVTGSCATLRDRNCDSGHRRVGASVRLMLRSPGRMPGLTDACEAG